MSMSTTKQTFSAGTDEATGSRESQYDAVVIGGGVGGLTAGALLAVAGKKILVVEAEAQPGGYARALRHGDYVFDRADHLIFGCAPESPFGPGLIDTVLRRLGVRDECDFVRMDDPIYVGQFPGVRVAVPHGREAYLDAHVREFPGQRAGLQRLVELSAKAARELAAFPVNPSLLDMLASPRRFPTLFRYRNATMRDVIDRELTDPVLKAVYETLWPWLGPPPGRASFLLWAVMMASYVEDGGYYCKGSFQRLADALAAGLRRAGGELVLGTQVTRILTDAGQVRGVELATGQAITASHVISNIDPRETFGQLLTPAEINPRYLRRLQAMEAGQHVAGLYVATDLDVTALGAQHDTTLYKGIDHDRAFRDALAGDVSMLSILIPTLKDPSLAPAGEHLVILKAITPRSPAGTAAGSRLEELMLAFAGQTLPGLAQHLTFVVPDQSGGHTHDLGAYAGWAPTPAQTGARRLPQRTPVAGLILAGQWTRPAHGIWTVVKSGISAAGLILGSKTAVGLPA